MAFNKSLAGYFDDLAHMGIPTDDLQTTIAFWEKLGFKKQGLFDTDNQGHQVVFMKAGHLMLEIWDSDGAVRQTGAINHISLNVEDADGAYRAAKAEGFNVKEPDAIKPDSYDIVVQAVGLPKTQEQAVEAARRGGQVLMFGVGNPDSEFKVNTYKVYQKQLHIQGSFINPYTFEDSVALLQSGDVDPLPLISNVLDFAHVEDFVSGKLGNISKAIVKVAGEDA